MHVSFHHIAAAPATSADGDGSINVSYLGRISNTMVNNAPESVLKTVAKGNIIKNRYGFVVPQLASYFLPIGELNRYNMHVYEAKINKNVEHHELS